MRLNFKEIIEGWHNHLVPPLELVNLIDEVSEHRLSICSGCPFQSKNAKEAGTYKGYRTDLHCTSCGCHLAAKSKSLSSTCPLGKWEAIATDEERYNIEKQIQNENNKLQTGDPDSTESVS
jgi:hypothetical protein